MAAQYFQEMNQSISYGTVDNSPPTFGGITGLSANANGSLTISWSEATDVSLTVSYKIYVKAGNTTGLFTPANLVGAAYALSHILYHLEDDSCLVEGVTYHVGVRAVDTAGNETSNTETMSAVSSGVYTNSIATAINSIVSTNVSLSSAVGTLTTDVDNLGLENTALEDTRKKLNNVVGLIVGLSS